MQYRTFKRCPKCQELLHRSNFSERANGNLAPYCRACQRDYSKQHYLRNSVKHNARRYVNSLRYKMRNRRYVLEYLRSHPCVDCGEPDPIVLEFDHVAEKKHNIGDLLQRGPALETVIAEIRKDCVRGRV
jgi:hypothetical protein